MEEKKYTIKELSDLADQYFDYADRDDIPNVGDFVDWIAAQEQYLDIKPATLQGEFECKVEPGAVDILLNTLKGDKPIFSRGIYEEHPPACTLCGVTEDNHWDSICATRYALNSRKAKPVLPEKYNEPVGAMRFPKDVMVSKEDCYVVLAEDGERMQDQINQLIDYLKDKNI